MIAPVSFTVYGVAQPKGSTRAFRAGRRLVVTSDNRSLKSWEICVRIEARRIVEQTHAALFDGAVSLFVVFRLPRPRSVSVKKRASPTTKPDLSKLVRGLEDALTGVVWRDDAQVVTIAAEKRYTDGAACADVTVEEITA